MQLNLPTATASWLLPHCHSSIFPFSSPFLFPLSLSLSLSLFPFQLRIRFLSFSRAAIFLHSQNSKMMKRFLTKSKKKPTSTISTLEKLHETLEMLEKKESVLQKKILVEIEKAKDYTKAKNKKAAIQCLKKKKLYETQIEHLGNFQLRVHDQMIMLEGARATTDTIDALRTGSAAVKSLRQSLSVEEIEKTMEQVEEHAENMKQIQEALATPVGATADFDEDELEAELEELEGEELEELLQPLSTLPAAPTSAPSAPPKATNKDVDELAALQAEMAV